MNKSRQGRRAAGYMWNVLSLVSARDMPKVKKYLFRPAKNSSYKALPYSFFLQLLASIQH
ncbi:MAG: hypothetical protein NZ519_09465 [Bacteroidia bacterium]|nr:hypothetical protein [Bacteroidia bacterium]MDW8301852.1 hypothetical protein [Bacteroidia bacterium]